MLAGETYNGQSFAQWMINYESVIRFGPTKVAPAMLASTERGSWNCDNNTMYQRMARLVKDNVTEVAIFPLSDSWQPTSCVSLWLPIVKAFLAGHDDLFLRPMLMK